MLGWLRKAEWAAKDRPIVRILPLGSKRRMAFFLIEPPAFIMTAGASAENLAANYLSHQGVKILARNHRCTRGELDLIGLQGGCVLFIEVRLRRNSRFGGAAASITPSKQQRVISAAQHWLQGPGARYAKQPCRFDAILFDALSLDRLQWLQDAFSA